MAVTELGGQEGSERRVSSSRLALAGYGGTRGTARHLQRFPRRFCLHPGLSEDLVGTYPPGAHSLVAVSVGEEWGAGCPLFCPPGGSPGPRRCLTPAP